MSSFVLQKFGKRSVRVNVPYHAPKHFLPEKDVPSCKCPESTVRMNSSVHTTRTSVSNQRRTHPHPTQSPQNSSTTRPLSFPRTRPRTRAHTNTQFLTEPMTTQAGLGSRKNIHKARFWSSYGLQSHPECGSLADAALQHVVGGRTKVAQPRKCLMLHSAFFWVTLVWGSDGNQAPADHQSKMPEIS